MKITINARGLQLLRKAKRRTLKVVVVARAKPQSTAKLALKSSAKVRGR